MLAWKWGPALACGNTIVMKAAEQTPLSALASLCELAQEAGFPPGVINLLQWHGRNHGRCHGRLIPDIDKIAFTGHVDTAKIITKRAADTLKRTTFELGGKSPNVDVRRLRYRARPWPGHSMRSTSTVVNAAPRAAACSSRKRSRKNLSRSWRPKAKQRRVGNQLDEKTEQGPQVSQEQLDKILGYCRTGSKAGCQRWFAEASGPVTARVSSSNRRFSITSKTTWRSPRMKSSDQSSACCRSRMRKK